MIHKSSKWLAGVAAAMIGLASLAAQAAQEMKPFILAETASGNITDKVPDVKSSLEKAGFEIAGEYLPYDSAYIIVVTNDNLKKAAASHDRGGYLAAQRVTLTKVGDSVQIAYTNPDYMKAAYRVKADVSSSTKALMTALGVEKEYGPDEGLTADDLEDYHYTFGMEYFDEPYELNDFPSHQKAVAAVEKGLSSGVAGTSKVYRIDIPGTKQTLFGVAMEAGKDGNKYMDEDFIMSEIDFKPIRSTGHLPYEILVTGGEVEALHARFRIAVNFPDLSMMGSNSFMNIMPTPDAIKEALTKVSGAEVDLGF